MGISKLSDYFKGKAVGASLDSQRASFGIPIKQDLAERLGINAEHSFPGKLQDGLFADSVTEQEKTNYNSIGRIS